MPLPDEFWDEERERSYFLLRPLVIEPACEVVVGGVVLLGIELDLELVNEAARAWAETYTYALVDQITDTSAALLQDEFSRWIASGEPLDDLIKKLEPMFGSVRAEMVAVTEVTRAFAEGNLIAWRESGVVEGKRWMTAQDDLVCSICAPLAGTVAPLDSDGFANGLVAPPAHVRCRCWLQPVVR